MLYLPTFKATSVFFESWVMELVQFIRHCDFDEHSTFEARILKGDQEFEDSVVIKIEHDHLTGQENNGSLVIQPRSTKIIKMRSTLITQLPFTLIKIGGIQDTLNVNLIQELRYRNHEYGKYSSIFNNYLTHLVILDLFVQVWPYKFIIWA